MRPSSYGQLEGFTALGLVSLLYKYRELNRLPAVLLIDIPVSPSRFLRNSVHTRQDAMKVFAVIAALAASSLAQRLTILSPTTQTVAASGSPFTVELHQDVSCFLRMLSPTSPHPYIFPRHFYRCLRALSVKYQ